MNWLPPERVRGLLVDDESYVTEYLTRLRPGQFAGGEHGVGDDYAFSVSSVPYCKNIGIRSLLSLVERDAGAGSLTLDLLGGAGQVAHAAREYRLCGRPEAVITADRESDQIRKAAARGLAAIPLDAADLSIIRPGSLARVLVAYGFHHLPPEVRGRVVSGALGCLEPSGFLVLYEGLHGRLMERISTEVIDALTTVPHEYQHPDVHDFRMVLALGELADDPVTVFDPQVFLGATTAQVEAMAVDYYIRHYALRPDRARSDLLAMLSDVCARYCPEPERHVFLGGDTWKLRGPEYLTSVYVGATPPEVRLAMFPDAGVEARQQDACCLIIPRFGVAARLRPPLPRHPSTA